MRIVRVLTIVGLVAGSLLAPVLANPATAGEPRVRVTPSTGLVRGDTVVVKVHGLPAHTAAGLSECDQFFQIDVGDVFNCPTVGSLTTNGGGNGSARLALTDPINVVDPLSSHRAYCRAEQCRMWVWWHDSAGDIQQVASAVMEFTGSPATIEANPNVGLVNRQRVRTHGTAYGAEGETIAVYQQVCAEKFGTTCDGESLRGSTVVHSDDTWSLAVRVRRFLPNADCTDLAAAIEEDCRLSVRVIDSSGHVDPSFGLPAAGEPGVLMLFAQPS
jgi:hypothetical protein